MKEWDCKLLDKKHIDSDTSPFSISVGSESRLSSMAGSTINLIVRATDGGNPPHSTSVPLTLNGKRRGMSTIDCLLLFSSFL